MVDLNAISTAVAVREAMGGTTTTTSQYSNPFFQIFANMADAMGENQTEETNLNVNFNFDDSESISMADILALLNVQNEDEETEIPDELLALLAQMPTEFLADLAKSTENGNTILSAVATQIQPTTEQTPLVDVNGPTVADMAAEMDAEITITNNTALDNSQLSGDTQQQNLFSLAGSQTPEVTNYAENDDGELEPILPQMVDIQPQTVDISEIKPVTIQNVSTPFMPITEQISTSIPADFAENSEFTMVLKPESLGEVTIKLVNEDGVQVLQITTATPEATKLINQDLSGLRESLSFTQIEVREAQVVQNAENAFGSQLDMGQQGFGNPQQQFGNSQSTMNFSGGSFSEETDESQEELQVSSSDLNIYI